MYGYEAHRIIKIYTRKSGLKREISALKEVFSAKNDAFNHPAPTTASKAEKKKVRENF